MYRSNCTACYNTNREEAIYTAEPNRRLCYAAMCLDPLARTPARSLQNAAYDITRKVYQ